MAKVIERREAHRVFEGPWRLRCKRCDSLVEFMRADRRAGPPDGEYYACPACGSFIPEPVVETLSNRHKVSDRERGCTCDDPFACGHGRDCPLFPENFSPRWRDG